MNLWPQKALFSQYIMKHSSFSCWIIEKLCKKTMQKDTQETCVFFFLARCKSCNDSYQFSMRYSFTAMWPLDPGWEMFGLGLVKLVMISILECLTGGFFCFESSTCEGLHSGHTHTHINTDRGKFDVFWAFGMGFSWAEAKLRHVRRSWLCWRSYLSHHLRQWCDGFSLGRLFMGDDVRCGL